MQNMYVYLLRSVEFPERNYVGLTDNPRRRLDEHNSGLATHTYRFRPWRLIASIWLENPDAAVLFERYLKSGSGRAFAKRHFW